MPRMARVHSQGQLIHIMSHSIEKRTLFVDDNDRLEFLSRFEKGITDSGFECITWSLMDNHYHLFIRINDKSLGTFMRSLNGGYALYYNKRHNKHGYLFQGRYKSIPCQDLNYALTLIRYINLNPLRAGMVKSLEELRDYQWCGHGCLLGNENAYGKNFQNRNTSLSFFDHNNLENARILYLKFLEESCKNGNKLAGQLAAIEAAAISGSFKGYPTAIGDPDFFASVLKKFKEFQCKMNRKDNYPHLLQTKSEEICRAYNITLSELKRRGRKNSRSKARAAFCYQLHVEQYIPQAVIARFLGITISPVSVLIQKGRAMCESVMENDTVNLYQTE